MDEIKNRKSPLIFLGKHIEERKIYAMLEAARLAPSSYNHQPWRYIVVNDTHLLTKVQKGLAIGNFWAKTAPVLIIVLSKPTLDDQIDRKEYYLYDTGLSVMSLVIEGMHQGIATHQMIGFDEKAIKKELALSKQWRILTIIAVGYEECDKSKENIIKKFGMQLFDKLRTRLITPRKRKEIKEIAYFNAFNEK